MKKIFTLLFISVFIFTGCSMKVENKNTPTYKVKTYLDSYNKLDDNLLDDLNDLIDDMKSYSDTQKERYRELMKKHYKDLKYDIKSEKIDGDDATVEVEIEVYDYSNIMNKNVDMSDFKKEDETYDMNAYYNYQLDQLEKVKNKVKYTINFSLKKDNGEWTIIEPSEVVKQKIHGIYAK
jgi:hypothetical protein